MQRSTVDSARLRWTRISYYFLFTIFFLTISLISALAFSASVTLAWDPNFEADVAGYKIYYGTESRDYIHVVDISNHTSCTISGLVPGVVYYLAVTAYDVENNESGFSEEIAYEVPTSAKQKSMPGVQLLLLQE